MICMGMCGNGVVIGMENIKNLNRQTLLVKKKAKNEWSVAIIGVEKVIIIERQVDMLLFQTVVQEVCISL